MFKVHFLKSSECFQQSIMTIVTNILSYINDSMFFSRTYYNFLFNIIHLHVCFFIYVVVS